MLIIKTGKKFITVSYKTFKIGLYLNNTLYDHLPL